MKPENFFSENKKKTVFNLMSLERENYVLGSLFFKKCDSGRNDGVNTQKIYRKKII